MQSASRVGTTKITHPDALRRLLLAFDLCTPAHPDDLVIDNTILPAEEVARMIAVHVGLVSGTRAMPDNAGPQR